MASPTFCAISIFFKEIGLPITASMRKKEDWPPSRTGMGKRFRTARFTLISAREVKQVQHPQVGLLAGHLRDQNRSPERLEGTMRWMSLTIVCRKSLLRS